MRIIKNISLLLSSNLLGSVINLLVAPIITRLYGPENFGHLAIFLSIATISGMIVTLKWENILFIESKVTDQILNLTTLSIIVSITLLTIVLLIMWSQNILIPNLVWLIFLLIYVTLLGFYYFGRSYHSSLGNYKMLSYGFLIKIFISNLIFLIFGYFWGSIYTFLIFGTILGQFFETALLLYKYDWNNFKFQMIGKEIKNLAVKYKKFPLFTLPGELVGNLNSQMPIFVLSNGFGTVVTGYFSLIQRLFGIPLKLFTSSTAEVFRREAALRWQTNRNFKMLAIKTSVYLFMIGLLPSIGMFFFSDYLIPAFFGEQWSGAVPYFQSMLFLFMLQFSISPISYGLYISEKQEVDFIWQVLLLLICSFGMLLTLHFRNSLITIISYVVTYSLMYVVYFLLIVKFSKSNVK